jgi:hypothetical protein
MNTKKIIPSFIIFTIAISLHLLAVEPSPQRVWTDSAGKFLVNAAFDSVSGDRVVLKNTEGKSVTLPLSGLCAADQAMIRQLSGDDAGLVNEALATVAVANDVRVTVTGKLSEYISSSSEGGEFLKESLDLHVTLTGETAAQAYAMDVIKLDRVAMGSTFLYGQSRQMNCAPIRRKFKIGYETHPKDGIVLKYKYSDVPQDIRSVGPVKGSVIVMTGGEQKTLELDVAQLKNNELIIDLILSDAGITGEIIRSTQENGTETLGVELKSASAGSIQEMSIIDDRGKELSASQIQEGSRTTLKQTIFGIPQKKLKGAKMIIRFNTIGKEMRIPFHVDEVVLQ